MDFLKETHEIHALAVGGVVYYATDSPMYGVISASGAYWYMKRYGHPFINNLNDK